MPAWLHETDLFLFGGPPPPKLSEFVAENLSEWAEVCRALGGAEDPPESKGRLEVDKLFLQTTGSG